MSATRPPRVKFCGITRVEDAEYAVSLGAWAVGINLWAGSSRVALPQEAADIADAVRRKIEIVGVFVNEELDAVVSLADQIGLTMVQLHGEEGPVYCETVARRSGTKVIKAARVRSNADIQALHAFRTDFHLLDGYVPGMPGGTGQSWDWELAKKRRSKVPMILSGGLNPANVAEAAAAAQPFAVDVASGVESAPGVKDHALMDAFIEALRPPVDDLESVEGSAEPVEGSAEPVEGSAEPVEGSAEPVEGTVR
jgi:phosphoribosylanthranilate isomerase